MKPAAAILKYAVIGLLVSCATSSSPPVTYYHLYANAEALTQLDNNAVILLQPVRIPEIIKRQPIVSHGDAHSTLIISNTQLWAGDLREMVYETLLVLLRHQLPHAEINSIASARKNETEFRLSVQLQEFIGQLNGECSLRASWQLVDQSGATVIHRETVLNKKIPNESYAGYVQVLNQLLSQFSQVIAKELNSIQ